LDEACSLVSKTTRPAKVVGEKAPESVHLPE
jgi:hypothetical protein